MAYKYHCRRCGCTLDPKEMPYCEECVEEMEQEAEQRRIFNLTIEDQQKIKRFLQGGMTCTMTKEKSS